MTKRVIPLLVLAIAFLGVLAVRLAHGEYDRRLVYFAIVVVCMIAVYAPFTKNLRYGVLFELPIRVFAVSMVAEICRTASARRSAILSAAVVAALCFAEWRSFDLYGVHYRTTDPVTLTLAGMRHVVPFAVR